MSAFLNFLAIFISLLPLILTEYFSSYPQQSIYIKLTQEEEFEGFAGLIRNNREARMDLQENELTAFIPTNEAFQHYEKPLHSELAFYHLAKGVRTLDNLKRLENISSVKSNYPKLWITIGTERSIFINNAKVITSKSSNPGWTKSGKSQDQMLHIIDEVLDPIIRAPKFPHTAYDFMALTYKWNLDTDKTVTSFFHKVQENQLLHLYQLEGANTYFIPVDRSIDSKKFKMLNKYAIFGHMIPNFVLFTRPTMRSFNYETMANEDDIYTVLSFEEIGKRLFVQGTTITGNENNPKGSFMAEIIEANIPVYNGVIHLISEPLGVFNKTLKPFPYLRVMERLGTDPSLNTVYELGEKTGFNNILTTHNVSFTYFVPNDYAWRQIKKNGLGFSGTEVDLLKRHLIISDSPYSMERLLALSVNRNSSEIEVKTVGGILKLNVLLIKNNFYIRWRNSYIKVIRPNYECPDGLIHVLAGPIANLY